MAEREFTGCSATGCTLRGVAGDCCIFHSAIERRYWNAVTEILNDDPIGETLIARSRENRMLENLGVFHDAEQYSHNSALIPVRDIAWREAQKLQKAGKLPEGIDLDNRAHFFEQLTQSEPLTLENGHIWSVSELCNIYELHIIDIVRDRAIDLINKKSGLQ